ncbi:Dynein [Rhodotorula toruloides ATCC 204091]|uniref:Dynein n=2 Tax=Rhodotorula toruloides TaxID=5286 RepID=A0A2T0AHD3_RHOTO|nr:Dynein [Rhodotorula toruloides ATCC 204091]PRQ77419.1 dynein [Rhodotorula toruloides]
MRSLDDDETAGADVKRGTTSAQPAWMRVLKKTCLEWLDVLPKDLPTLPAAEATTSDPLARFFEREVSLSRSLVPSIRADLENLVKVCDGELKQTNAIRSLLSDLNKGTVPATWKRYRCRDLPASVWIADLAKRLAQLQRIVANGDLAKAPVAPGLLFHPHGYFTASRQAVAHATKTSLEELSMHVNLEETGGQHSFVVEGLALVGATWESSRLAVNDGSAVRLEASSISWKPKQRDTPSPPAGYKMMSVPCFLDSTRADVLLNVEVPVETTNSTMVIQRAVALVAALD